MAYELKNPKSQNTPILIKVLPTFEKCLTIKTLFWLVLKIIWLVKVKSSEKKSKKNDFYSFIRLG
eukprot:Pgem_evm1s19676